MTERQITIAHDVDASFAVKVRPPIEGEDLDGTFATHREARGWAGGLRMTRGFQLIDEVEASHG